MSAGLMSCVRENSPPMGNEGATISVAGTQSSSNTDTDTVKRRRFHPLRNLRKIFRRRTVSHAEAPPLQIHNFGTGSSSTTDTTTVSSKSGGQMPISGGYLYLKRDHSTDRYPGGRNAEDESSDMDNNRCEISDCQRSFSEGRLIDSDISREHLSQSHDSVFSESATASSLSIVLKAELTDVLRKRGLRQEASEEEDLGLPQSPNSPSRKEKVMHHSQGSLSILSITSSDMDDEHSSLRQNTTFDSSTSSSYFNKSSDISHGSDEVDLDLSSSSRLSHSAARHKLAVRPKKKGPSRPRRSREQTNVLPSTPEVNEEVLKHAASNSDITDTPTKKLKSQSLPRETDSKQMFAFSSNVTTKSEIIRTPQKTTIYVNKNISKSHDFDKPVTTTNIIVSGTQSTVTSHKKSDDTSLIKKFWSRSVKKQKDDEIDMLEAEDEQEERTSECMEHKSILQINTGENAADVHVKVRAKSGPAARQRIVPKEIEEPIKERASIFVGQKPPVEVTVKNQTGTKPIPIARTHIANSPARVFVHKSQEDLLSKSYEKEIKAHSISPPKTSWQEQHQLKAPKICGLSSLQQKISHMDTESPNKKTSVPKSNSFRVYNTSVGSESNLEKNNLPSLPNLSKINDDEELLKISEEPLKFSSLTEHYTEKKRLSQEKVSDMGKQKFEINDYNLVKHKKETGVEIVGVLKKKNIVLKGVEELSQSTVSNNSTNISQIEENIDKLMKSSVVTVLKNASFEEDDIKMEVIESSTSSGSTTPESSKSPVKETRCEVNETEAVLREKRVSSVLEQFEAKMSPEIKAKPPIKVIKNEVVNDDVAKVDLRECKPPKPPTSFRISPKNTILSETTPVEAPSSPVKAHNAVFEETEPRRSIIGENDDRKVILQRRTSVSEERLKFERRISGGPTEELNKNERKKSQSEEDLDVKPKDSSLSSQNTRKSTSTSDDDDTPVVNLRKKSNEKIFGDAGKNDETPELMKVFARRSLKIPLDDDDNIHVQEIKKIAAAAAANNVDSDKENQSSSEEKLDKISNNNQSTTTTGQTNNNNNHSTTVPTKSSSATTMTTTTVIIKENNENVIPVDVKANLVTPKPFGTPSRFSNVANYRNSATFIETRNKNLQTKTLSSNNNVVTGNSTITTVTNSTTTSSTKTLTQDVKNNNSTNIRHTIGAIVNENMSKKIETSEPEEIEFKGILQRRAEWEKRAKEGFK